MAERVVVWWVRRDLRLTDNLALAAALASGARVLPVFIFDPALLRGERFSPARLRFLLDGLRALHDDLRARGGGLLVRHGDPRAVLPALIRESGAQTVFAARDYSPYAARRDRGLRESLPAPLVLIDDALLHPPEATLKANGTPFLVYTPFKRHWLSLPKPAPVDSTPPPGALGTLDGLDAPPVPSLSDLGIGETIAVPPAGEAEAARRLRHFIDRAIAVYDAQRDRMAIDPFSDEAPGTSGLSPYFRFGMLSPRRARAAAADAWRAAADEGARQAVEVWVSELAWREFYMTILFHFPGALDSSFRPEYERLPFREAPDDLAAWAEGRTGYPVVDAAMRQLAASGWMHNRARMIVASFLTKHLLIYWRAGDVHFMRHLIDGDPAANNGGWQWSAGTGTDAQPYFRIFNPVTQSQKFDPDGAYIRRWVPELRGLRDARAIHQPWTLDSPPRDYPPPIVEHAFARQRALAAFGVLKTSSLQPPSG